MLFKYKVILNDGFACKETYDVEADSEQEALDKGLETICKKLYEALPELDIQVTLECEDVEE